MEDNIKIVDLNQNDEFSRFNGSDIQELLLELSNYYLTLRSSLGIDKNITFGTELEFEFISYKNDLQNEFDETGLESKGWDLGHDNSLTKGAEIRSPILKDNITSWKDLMSICQLAYDYGKEGVHSAGHIHVGAHVLETKMENWTNFLALWMAYENIIYRSVYNEYLNKFPGIHFCNPINHRINDMFDIIKEGKEDISLIALIMFLSTSRKQAVNFLNVNMKSPFKNESQKNNTLEFRCPNGTLDPVIWQNNINLFTHILMYSKSKKFEMDTIANRNDIKGKVDYSLYNQIFVEQVLEFVDLIFDRNIDKIYFLRQYFKNFDISDKEMKRTKRFTEW